MTFLLMKTFVMFCYIWEIHSHNSKSTKQNTHYGIHTCSLEYYSTQKYILNNWNCCKTIALISSFLLKSISTKTYTCQCDLFNWTITMTLVLKILWRKLNISPNFVCTAKNTTRLHCSAEGRLMYPFFSSQVKHQLNFMKQTLW